MALENYGDVLLWLYKRSPYLEQLNPSYQSTLINKLRVWAVTEFDMTGSETRVLTLAIVLCCYRAHRRLAYKRHAGKGYTERASRYG